MKSTTLFTTLFTLAAVTSAAPVNDVVRRELNPPATGTNPPYAYDQSNQHAYPSGGYPCPSGTAAPTGYPMPTGTAPAMMPTATSTTGSVCSTNGALLCNGPTKFGLCNWGQVVWQDVALGTACQVGDDGVARIGYAPGYPQ